MNIEEIESMWAVDAPIDEKNLTGESSKVGSLHNKYYKIYIREALKLAEMKAEHSKLYKDKYEYFQGRADLETLKKRNWEQFQLKIIKDDIPRYIDADDEMIKFTLRTALQKEKVAFLESILNRINFRQNSIKDMIAWEKFKAGS